MDPMEFQKKLSDAYNDSINLDPSHSGSLFAVQVCMSEGTDPYEYVPTPMGGMQRWRTKIFYAKAAILWAILG